MEKERGGIVVVIARDPNNSGAKRSQNAETAAVATRLV